MTVDEHITEEPKLRLFKNKIHLPKEEPISKIWLDDIYTKRQNIIDKKAIRRQRRQDMAKRGTAASLERMRLISQLARKDKRDDDFGSRDEDWDVYKVINKVCLLYKKLDFFKKMYFYNTFKRYLEF